MLAKEMKIQSLMTQRKFIIDMMKSVYEKRTDGDAGIIYKGIIYPENIQYFSEEGFVVRTLDSERIIAEHCMPLNIFYPKSDIELTEEEIMESDNRVEERRKANPKNMKEICDYLFEDMFKEDKE